MAELRITEIFHSLQGESRTVGFPTAFIRLTGCPLRCTYCDTAYAFTGGKTTSIDEILQTIEEFQTPYVTVTGGEPLAQKNCLDLLTALVDREYKVSLETSGAVSISDVDNRVVVVMDLKTPSSGEVSRNLYSNLSFLKPKDQVKFVIGDEIDYQWARGTIKEHEISKHCEVLFSPCHGMEAPTVLANKIVRDRLPVRFQIQLHKVLWGDSAGK